MHQARTGVRERTRRAVQREITEVAEQLFVERGYEATTIEQIAAEVGMSRRTPYRYFPTREDIVLGKLDLVADEILSALRSRPDSEPVWASLRHAFDLLIAHMETPGKAEFAAPMQHIIFEAPGLLGHYLEKLERAQVAATAAVRERAESAGNRWAADDPTPRAVVDRAMAEGRHD